MNNTDLDMLASATKQARDSLTDEIYVELWKRIHDATSAYLKHAKVWFDDMPGGRWNVDAAQKTGVMPHVNYATRELTAQISALFRDAAIEVRRRCYLRGIKAAQVNQEIVGEKPAEPLDVVFQPKKESLRVNGRAVTVLREAEPTDDSEGRWVTVNGAHIFIKGPGEQKSRGATAHHGVPSYRINSNDGGVGPSIQYHGTSAPDFKTFGDDPVYLVDDPLEARGYASTTGVGWGSKGGKERVLAIRRSPGSTLDLDREINDAVVEEDDPNSIIDSLMHRAKSDGYRYVSFVHPGFTSDEQRVLVSLYPKEDLKIVGKIGKKREAEMVLPNLTTIDPRIQGKDLDRALAIIAKIPPPIRALPKQIVLADLGAVHGEWEDGTILLNPSVLKSKQKFGTHNRISRLEHTLVHEYMHAWGEKAGLDTSPEWLALSGWQYSPDETPKGTARYVEKREGWPKEKTEWVHEKKAWFPRPYSSKSPEEDFADCARDLMAGWEDSFNGGGEAKRDWMTAHLPGALRESGEWDEEKHPRDEKGRWTTGGDGGMSRPETTDDSGKKIRDATYHDASGNPVDAETQSRLDALKLPPAWTDVRLNPDPNGSLQAVGRDSKGRMQYVYSAAHSEAAAAEKFARLAEFTKELPLIRERINETLNNPNATATDRDAAIVLTLIDRTGFRIGSDSETGGAKQAYGASTLRADHVRVDGDKLSFSFTGKKGVEQSHEFEDARLASLIAPKVQLGGRLFNVSDSQVRDYLHAKDGDFKVKDYRTYNGTATAIKEMAKLPKPKSEKEFKSAQKAVAKAVGKHLGNTPAMALGSYIDPAVWGAWKH